MIVPEIVNTMANVAPRMFDASQNGMESLSPYAALKLMAASLLLFSFFRDQFKEKLLQVVFSVPLAQFGQRAIIDDPAARHDSYAIAEFFRFAHDVR